MSRLAPEMDEEGNPYQRPPRAGIWMGGVDQLDTLDARRAFVAYLGETTALYRIYECSGSLIYVGITGDPLRRFKQHADKEWWSAADVITVTPFPCAGTARAAERYAIRHESPLYNIQDSQRASRG